MEVDKIVSEITDLPEEGEGQEFAPAPLNIPRIILTCQKCGLRWPVEYRGDVTFEKFFQSNKLCPNCGSDEIRMGMDVIKEWGKWRKTEFRGVLSTAIRDIDTVWREYVEKISKIEAVREILVVEEEKVTTVWTIIKAPPFEDSVREPIYTAQLQTLRSLEQDIPIDFYILNESELSSDKNLSDVIPSNARPIWRR